MEETVICKMNLMPLVGTQNRNVIKISVEADNKGKGESLVILTKDESVEEIIKSIQEKITKPLLGKSFLSQTRLDKWLIDLDGTFDRSVFGKKVIFGVSEAICKLGAKSLGLPLYMYLGGISGRNIPYPIVKLPNEQIVLMQDIYPFSARMKLKHEIEAIFEEEKTITEIVNDLKLYEVSLEQVSMQETSRNSNVVVIDKADFSTISELIVHTKHTKMKGNRVVLKSDDETEDCFIADFSVGLNLSYVDFGDVISFGHLIKYNRLMEIEAQLV